MTKARMTFRFDRDGQAQPNRGQEEPSYDVRETRPAKPSQGQVIPLLDTEYDVQDELVRRPPIQHEDEVGEIRKGDRTQLNQFTTDFGAWSSPFDSEVQRLEQIIRGTDRPSVEPASRSIMPPRRMPSYEEDHAEDRYDSETGYYDARPALGPIVTEGPSTTRMMRNSRTPWFKIGASVSGAVITGVVFGWFVLSLFTDVTLPGTQPVGDTPSDQIVTDTRDGEVNPPVPDGGQTVIDHNDGDSKPALDQEGLLRVDLPARSYQILQHGIFSTTESAMAAQSTLQSMGFSGASEMRDNIHVYAGIATSREDAIALKHQLDEAEAEVFIKSYTIPAVSTVQWGGKATEAVAGYFEQGSALVESISRISAVQINSAEPTAFEPQSLEQIGAQHQAWSALSGEVSAGLSEDNRQLISKMDNAMNTAVMLLSEYNKNPSFSYLWQAQAAIMQFTFLENGLLSRLAAS